MKLLKLLALQSGSQSSRVSWSAPESDFLSKILRWASINPGTAIALYNCLVEFY